MKLSTKCVSKTLGHGLPYQGTKLNSFCYTQIRGPSDSQQCTDKERHFILLYKSQKAQKNIKYLFFNDILLIGHFLTNEHMASINNNKQYGDPISMES